MADDEADDAATATRAEQRTLPDRVTMPLLTLVTSQAIDEDYVHAARRRAAGGGPAPGGAGTRLRGAVVVLAVFGVLIALAAVQTARNADVRDASRSALVDRIDERQGEVDALAERISTLRRQIDELRASGARNRTGLAQATVDVRALQIATGFIEVRGPGLRITVDDNPDVTPDPQDDRRVRASDLRLLVNGLWRAGAEAIAVNGRRLTVMSAIVNSSISIAVNRSPLSPPYVVSAIGGENLGARLQDTTTGAQFDALADELGLVVTRQNETELLLPAAPEAQLRLRYVEQGGPSQNTQEDIP